MLNPILQQYHFKNRYFDIFSGSTELETKKLHIQNVLSYTEKLFDTLKFQSDIDRELLLFCAEHHDDGRVKQYSLLGKFMDTEVSHTVLGVYCFDSWLYNSSFVSPLDQSIQIFRDVLMYHGKTEFCINEFSKPYVDFITCVDELENSSSCVSYLIREIETDAKGYKHKYPEIDQHSVSSFVWKHFTSGEKFDKIKYCKTYAEYVLFAATLMISCIKKYSFAKNLLLQPGYGYNSILDGYKDVFDHALSSKMSKQAYMVLRHYSE